MYTRCYINTIDSPDDEHRGAQNMWRIGINIYEKRIVRQIGYLQKLYNLSPIGQVFFYVIEYLKIFFCSEILLRTLSFH
jgi:hypothetical protein